MDRKLQHLRAEIEAQQQAGVLTDQWLLPKFFKLTRGAEVHLVATDSFIGKSKEQYNAAWLARELIQNFVDHNPEDPSTLNGVDIITQELPESDTMPKGGKRFVIEGNWKFDNPTGVISPHSEKSAGMETAGGNGIGLKQSALRIIRDFGAQKFEINGEGWTVSYDMVKKDDVNKAMAASGSDSTGVQVRHDWLVADLAKTDNHGKNSYVIETDNPELIKALSELPNLGVSDQNPYLQNLDLKTGDKNKSLSLKWLQPEGKGRLFLNGQVMNYEKSGKDAEDYWQGPEGVVVALKGVKYKMSIDRPPVNRFDFGSYIKNFLKTLATGELAEQLQKSYNLWRGHNPKKYQEPGFLIVVEEIIDILKTKKDFTAADFKNLFPEKLLADDMGLKEADRKKLETEGYVICPGKFAEIGMDKVSVIFRPDEAMVRENMPDSPRSHMDRMAEETGLQVYFENFGRIPENKFVQIIDGFAKKYSAQIEVTNERITILIPDAVDRASLYSPVAYPKKDNRAQQILFELRSIIQHGLKHGLFEKTTHTKTDNVLTTYKTEVSYAGGDAEEMLVIKNTPLDKNIIHGREKQPLSVTITLTDRFNGTKVNELLGATSQESTPTTPDTATKSTLARPASIPAGKVTERQQKKEPPAKRLTMADLVRPDLQPPPQSSWWKKIVVGAGVLAGLYGGNKVLSEYAQDQKTTAGDTKPTIDKKLEEVVDLAKYPTPTEALSKAEARKKRSEENKKFAKFALENPGAFLDSSGTGKADITTIKRGAADVPANTHKPENRELHDDEPSMEDAAIEDFEPLKEITPQQAQQLKALTSYLEITTNADLSKIKFFIFKGKGTLGVNRNKEYIGLHEAMFETDFFEALSTLIHEVAHCDPEASGHDNEFRHTMQSLFSAALEKEHFDTDPNSSGFIFRKNWDDLRLKK